jgi:hypothetical protein
MQEMREEAGGELLSLKPRTQCSKGDYTDRGKGS